MSERSKDTGKSHNIFGQVDQYKNNAERLREKITFEEYVNKIVENPSLVRTSHQTVYNALTSREDFFTTGRNALFGAEKTVENFTTILKGGAEGLEIGKRIILLVGPPGSGKSTLVNGTKRGIEDYSKTEEGAMYAIDDCPMHEDPLHLIPEDMRPMLREEFGIHIDGDLCPQCAEKYGSDNGYGFGEGDDQVASLQQVPISRIVLSEKNRVGIGTFKPSDPKSQDITELVGSVDFSKLGEFGTASDARAYRFDGELNVANRGVMEFVEMLKSDERFLYSLLDLAQDRVIKAPRFPNISADEVILAHTNMTEYYRYVNDPKNEALRDRMVVIPVPYALRVNDEEKIHKKLIGESEQVRKAQVHINPQTLSTAAMFAVLSRLQPSAKMSKVQKMKVYNGEAVDGVSKRDIKELIEEAGDKEGMSGISPRYIIDSLSMALSKQEAGKQCITPMDAIRALQDNLKSHPHTRDMKADDKKALQDDIAEVYKQFTQKATDEVYSAFIGAFEDQAESLCQNYLNNVQAYLTNDKVYNSITQQEREPDEKLMRSIEEQIKIAENGKKEFRNELSHRMNAAYRNGGEFNYKSHPRLHDAIKGKLFADMKDTIKLVTTSTTQTEKGKKRIRDVEQTLVNDYDYCEHCASEIVQFVGEMISRS